VMDCGSISAMTALFDVLSLRSRAVRAA